MMIESAEKLKQLPKISLQLNTHYILADLIFAGSLAQSCLSISEMAVCSKLFMPRSVGHNGAHQPHRAKINAFYVSLRQPHAPGIDIVDNRTV